MNVLPFAAPAPATLDARKHVSAGRWPLSLLKFALFGQLIWGVLKLITISMCSDSRWLLLSLGMYVVFDTYIIMRGFIAQRQPGNSSSPKTKCLRGAALLSAPLLDIVMYIFLDFIFPIIHGCVR